VISPRKISPADRTRKQHVANRREPRGGVKKYDMAWCMAGTMPYLERFSSHVDLIPLIQPSIRHKAVALSKAVLPRLPWQILNKEQIVWVRPFDRHSLEAGKFRRRSSMVEVAVGEQNLLRGKPLTLQ
jgi:hypothetical protein